MVGRIRSGCLSTSDNNRLTGKLVTATNVITHGPSARQTRNVTMFLAASIALVMTGYGIVMPVFARRLGDFGSGVEALGFMTMGFALAQFVLAPIMGSIADRIGRRPLVLIALGGFAVTNLGFIFAPNTGTLIGLRCLQGGVTAGMLPAAQAMVGDITPNSRRAQGIGMLMGGYGFGFVLGPVIGGLLYDTWGFIAPFAASAAMAAIALVFAQVMIQETLTPALRHRIQFSSSQASEKESIIASLPRPLYIFGALLLINFILIFAFAFIQPELVFYAYDELAFTTIQFGFLVGIYGLAMVLGQVVLGGLSDKYGRKPVITIGLLTMSLFFLGLMFFNQFAILFIVAAVGGLGNAIATAATSAHVLDITAEQSRSRVMGIRGSFAALGGALGPLLVVVISPHVTPQIVFMIGAIAVAATALLALAVLRGKRQVVIDAESAYLSLVSERAPVAAASLRALVGAAKLRRSQGASQ